MKWFNHKKNVQVGNVVLRRDETATGQTHKYARILQVHDSTDKMAWSVDMEYKLPGEKKFWVTIRPIHKLIMAVTI
jgi:hypothetical protein